VTLPGFNVKLHVKVKVTNETGGAAGRILNQKVSGHLFPVLNIIQPQVSNWVVIFPATMFFSSVDLPTLEGPATSSNFRLRPFIGMFSIISPVCLLKSKYL